MRALLAVLALIPSLAAAAVPAPEGAKPARGGFDWTTFEGRYAIKSCAGGPLWGDAPEGSFVEIYVRTDYAVQGNPRSLELMRAHPRVPIALGLSLDNVGLDPQARRNPETGAIDRVSHSYATADGAYGLLSWDNPGNVGWITVQLRKEASGEVTMTQRRRRDDDAAVVDETCTLAPAAAPRGA